MGVINADDGRTLHELSCRAERGGRLSSLPIAVIPHSACGVGNCLGMQLALCAARYPSLG